MDIIEDTFTFDGYSTIHRDPILKAKMLMPLAENMWAKHGLLSYSIECSARRK
jgi:hypothetical protein